ncbi:MAG: glycosyltransferase family 39 protein [bacterium]|nr:glycosyltransferase family 39 protein [bacterium]
MIHLVLFVLSGLGFSAGSESIGSWIVARFGFPIPSFPFVVRMGLGLVFLTFVLILTGSLVGFVPWMLWLLWLLWVCLGVVRSFSLFHALRAAGASSDGLSRGLRWGTVLLLLLCLGTVMTPETRHDTYDYHLSIPNTYLAFGQIIEMPWHVFTYMPKNGEILYVLALAVGNDSIAKLIHFIFGCGCLGAIAAIASRLGGARIGWMAAFCAGTIPLFGFLSTAAYVDLIRSFWELLALLMLFEAWQRNAARQSALASLALSALFAGMAIGTKYTAWLIFAGPYLLLLGWVTLRAARLNWVQGLGLLLLVVLPVLPWLAYNTLWTANPMYPFFPTLFGAHTPAALDAYAFIAGHAPEPGTLCGLSLLNYVSQRIGNLLLEGNNILLLGGIALLLCPWAHRLNPDQKNHPALYGLILYILLSFSLFLTGSNNMDGRFCFTTLALLAVPLSMLYVIFEDRLRTVSDWKRGLVPGLAALLLLNALWYRAVQLDQLNESLLPRVTQAQRDAFLQNHFPTYPLDNWANQNLPRDAFVLGLGYPVHRKTIYGTKHGYIPFLEPCRDDPAIGHVARLLERAGVTHIVKPYPRTPYAIAWEELEPEFLIPLYEFNNKVICRFIPPENKEGV